MKNKTIVNKNKTISLALLESYRNVLYEVKKFYDSVDFDTYGDDVELKIKVMSAVLKAGESLGKNIESLDKLEDKVIREEKAMISRKGSAETSMFES
jgi:hypothetical protein